MMQHTQQTKLSPEFVRIPVDAGMKSTAYAHALKRTAHIKRQFTPSNAPLSHAESNYIGCLGELITRRYFARSTALEDNYHQHLVDSGDLTIGGKIYDVKTDAVMLRYYTKLYSGSIQKYDPYGCRVFTSKHLHHLKKYTGGLIFTVIPIPDDSKKDRRDGHIRKRVIEFISHGIIVGYISAENIYAKTPTWFSPPNPVTGRRRKYNSENYLFHHSELQPVSQLREPV